MTIALANVRQPLMTQLSNVLIRRVMLPADLQAAIDRKMIQDQAALEYAYRIDRERLEAERKRVEAAAIRDFQKIVGANLTDPYLRWLGIDATLRLARQPSGDCRWPRRASGHSQPARRRRLAGSRGAARARRSRA